MSIVVAIEKPNNTENIRNMTIPAFAEAASASTPKNCPIHTEFTEWFSDCRMFTPSDGNANKNNVLPTGPMVRSRWDFGEDIGSVMANVRTEG